MKKFVKSIAAVAVVISIVLSVIPAAYTASEDINIINEENNGSIQTEDEKTMEGNTIDATTMPLPTDTPSVTEAPTTTDTPSVTEAPTATKIPSETEAPTATKMPSATEAPTADNYCLCRSYVFFVNILRLHTEICNIIPIHKY